MSRNTRLALAATAALVAASVVVGTQIVSGQSTAQETVFVPVVPCRLVDTRPANNNIGPIATKIGAAQTVTFNAHAANDGNSTCAIPSTATAIATNATAIAPTAGTFITLFPGNADNPGTSNLNVVGGAAPTPNSVNVPLAPNGEFKVFNNAGTVNIAIDINGYFQPSTSIGSDGPKGDPGTPGTPGTNGAPGPAGPTNRMTDQQIVTMAWSQDPGREARMTAGGNPTGIASDGNRIYVTNDDDDNVSVIDPTTNTVVDTITVGDSPRGIAYNGTSLYVANGGSSATTVSVINPATNAATTITVGNRPRAVTFNGTNIYVANSDDTVSVISPANQVIATVSLPAGSDPVALASANGNVYVINDSFTGTSTVNVIDPSNQVTNVTLPNDNPRGIAYTGTYIYVTHGTSNVVSVIDPIAGAVVGGPISVGDNPSGIAYDGTNLYIANDDGTLSVIDPTGNQVIGDPIPLNDPSSKPKPVFFDGTNLWITGINDIVNKVLPN